jgi:hypothetical protein
MHATWSSAYRAAKPPRQAVGPPLGLTRRTPHDGCRPRCHGSTLTRRDHLPPWSRSGGGRASPRAEGLSPRPLCGLACSAAWAPWRGSPGGAPRASGGRRGGEGERRGATDPPALGVERHGPPAPAQPCRPGRGAPSRAGAAVVGASAGGGPCAGAVLSRSLGGRHREQAGGTPPRPHEARPDPQAPCACAPHSAAARLPPRA